MFNVFSAAGVGTLVVACGLATATIAPPQAVALPAASEVGIAPLPLEPAPRLFQVLRSFRSLIPGLERITASEPRLTINFVRLLGKAVPTTEEAMAAKAACAAMNAVLAGTNEYDYWDEEIRSHISLSERLNSRVTAAAVDYAVDYAATRIAAVDTGVAFTSLYRGSCIVKGAR